MDPCKFFLYQLDSVMLKAFRMRRLLLKNSFRRFFSTYGKMAVNDKRLIAICQMTSKNSKEDNFETCKNLINLATAQHAKMVFLPEACDYIGESRTETLELAEPLDGPLVKRFCDIAKCNNVWLSLGGIHEKVSSDKVSNAHVVINNDGDIVAVYRKTHLFDVELPDQGIRLKESDYVLKGNEIIPPISSPVGNVGLAICYDMRFAELGLILAKMGAHVLTYPSAFTFTTGAAHWEVLLRARAIETQCYVVAAAQVGAHNKKRSSWGHAMIVDPWGNIIAQCSDGTNIAIAEVNLSRLDEVRASMPVWQHRRNDLYPLLMSLTCGTSEAQQKVYQFGQTTVKGDYVFYQTSQTAAFTNKRCVVPGHVLVMPIRNAKRLADLNFDEVADLFQVVQRVQSVMEVIHNVSSSTITVQDGVHAGQTIHHLHVHILPRRPGDFTQNDDIYRTLENHDNSGTKERSESDMAEEADMLRKYFTFWKA